MLQERAATQRRELLRATEASRPSSCEYESGKSHPTCQAAFAQLPISMSRDDTSIVAADSNVEIARLGFGAALRGDVEAIAEVLDPEVKWHGGDPAAIGSCRNRGEVVAFLRQSEVIRGGRFELVDVVAFGDKVVAVMRRPSASGAQVAQPVANLFRFRDGKVVEIVHYPDADDALAAARPRG